MYKFKALNGELYKRLKKIEDGEIPAPYILTLDLPLFCPLRCKFCAIKVYDNVKKHGYSKELEYIFTIFFDAFDIPKKYENIAREYARLEDNAIRKLLLERSIPAEMVNVIDMENMKPDDNLITIIPFQIYSVISRLKKISKDLSWDDLALLSAYCFKKSIAITIRNADSTLSLKDYIRYIDEAGNMGVQIIKIVGISEPFAMSEYLVPMIKEVKRKNMYGIVITSGCTLDKEIINLMVETGWDEVILSIDAAKPETRKLMRGDSLDRIFELMNYLNETRNKKNSSHPIIHFNYIVTNINYKEVIDSVKIAERYDVQTAFFMPIWLATCESIDMALSLDELNNLKDIIKQNRKYLESSPVNTNLLQLLDYNEMSVPTIFTNTPNYLDMKEESKCYTLENNKDYSTKAVGNLDRLSCICPWFEIAVEPSGPRLCSYSNIWTSNLDVKTSSLSQFWHSSEWNLIRKNFLEGHLPYECRENCPNDPSNFPKTILREYIELKNLLENTRLLPRPLRNMAVVLDAIIDRTFCRRPLEQWLLKLDFRINDPW